MKKIITLSMIFLSLMLVGCGKKAVDYETIMETQATAYYEKLLKGKVNLVDKFDVYIWMLKNANANGNNFDLSKLDKCTDMSYTTINYDKKTNEIISFENHLSCE